MSEKKNILIVDDQVEILNNLKTILKEDYDVLTAINGRDALETIHLFRFDLIVCDLNMPEIDGINLVRKLRAKSNQTPIVFVSGQVTMDALKSALRLEVSDVLEKPVKVSELKKCIEKTLQLQEAKINKQDRMVGLLQVTRENTNR